MSIDSSLLAILCCPVSHQPLKLMGDDALQRVNELIEARALKQRDGTVLEHAWAGALCTEDGRVAYPIEDDIPILLEERGIALAALT